MEVIKKRLRGEKFRMYTRVAANIGVYTSGNETRMGKGKGSFDFWAARVAVSQIVFEISGQMHEQVARDAMRLAGNKLPGKSTVPRYHRVKEMECVSRIRLTAAASSPP